MSTMLPAASAERRSLADVLPSCLAALAGEPNPLGIGRAERLLVVLVDGLGASSLRARAGHARTLATRLNRATTIVSGFPTTTAVALASLATGEPSGRHGLVGYRVLDAENDRVVNQLSGWDARMRPRDWQTVPTVFERATEVGVRALVIGPARYATSGLSEAILRGAEYRSSPSIGSRFEAARSLFDEGGAQLVYLYVPELDMAAHAEGWQSDRWLAALEEVDAAVTVLTRGLRRDEGVLVTADHGMVDVPAHQHVIIDDGPLLRRVRHVAGDPRCLQLHLEPGSTEADLDELVDAWRAAESGRAWIATRQEVIDAGWFGEVSDAARSRMGDVFVAARKAIAYYDGRDASGAGRSMVGQHGSFSDDELIVPLIGFGAAERR